MKTVCGMILALAFMPTLSLAQDIQFGVKAGGNVAISTGSYSDYHLGMNIQAEEIYADGASISYALGGLAVYPLSGRFSIMLEASLSAKTLKYEYYLKQNYSPSYSQKEYGLTKLEVPLLLGYQLLERMALYAGPSYGIIFSDEEDIASGELSMNIGLYYEVTQDIFVDARGSFGLSNLYDGDGIGYLELMPELGAQVIFLSAGYRLNL